MPKPEFVSYIAQNVVNDDLRDELDKLDEQYYELEDLVNLEVLVSNWIKTGPTKAYEQ
ncbi:MAG: hypothetical protein WBG71_07145 [Leeuwenhoekiella sp.]